MYKAKMIAYADESEDRDVGVFPAEFDAKIACERDATQPLQWEEYLSLGSSPYSIAEIVVDCVIKCAYVVSPIESMES